MSMPKQADFVCPKCQRSYKVTLWDSINTMVPTALQDVISGDLFRTTCPYCGQVAKVIYPCLFNDMEHGVMIQLQPYMTGEIEKGFRYISALKNMIGDYRIVTTPEQLAEKASIYNDGFDDRIIELCKIAAIVRLKGKKVDSVLYHSSDDADLLDVIANDTRITIGGNARYYSEIAGNPSLMEEIERQSKNTSLIDSDWARKTVAVLASKGY